MDADALAFEQRKGERLLAEAEEARFIHALVEVNPPACPECGAPVEDIDGICDYVGTTWHEEREQLPLDHADIVGEWDDPYDGPQWPGEGLDSM